MCGLFGFFGSTPDSSPDVELLQRSALAAGQRGPESFGIYARFPDFSSRTVRHALPLAESLSLLDDFASASLVIGHARLATSGTASQTAVQPIICGAESTPVVVAHNGNVYNHRELSAQFDLRPQTSCDSEVIALLTARSLNQGPTLALRAALAVLQPAPLALLVLAGEKFFAARRKLPLFFLSGAEGFYFCSVAFDSRCDALPDNSFIHIGDFGLPRLSTTQFPFEAYPITATSLQEHQLGTHEQKEAGWRQLPLRSDQY